MEGSSGLADATVARTLSAFVRTPENKRLWEGKQPLREAEEGVANACRALHRTLSLWIGKPWKDGSGHTSQDMADVLQRRGLQQRVMWTGERLRGNAAGTLAGHDWKSIGRGGVDWDWDLHRRHERKYVHVLNGHRQAYSGAGFGEVRMWE